MGDEFFCLDCNIKGRLKSILTLTSRCTHCSSFWIVPSENIAPIRPSERAYLTKNKRFILRLLLGGK